MKAKKLIEKLEDLATYLALAEGDANKQQNEAANMGNTNRSTFQAGIGIAYKKAFNKVDALIKEAKT